MNYEEYRDLVIKEAKKEYNEPLCLDSIKEAWMRNEDIKNAIDDVICDSMMWNEK